MVTPPFASISHWSTAWLRVKILPKAPLLTSPVSDGVSHEEGSGVAWDTWMTDLAATLPYFLLEIISNVGNFARIEQYTGQTLFIQVPLISVCFVMFSLPP